MIDIDQIPFTCSNVKEKVVWVTRLNYHTLLYNYYTICTSEAILHPYVCLVLDSQSLFLLMGHHYLCHHLVILTGQLQLLDLFLIKKTSGKK